MSRIECRTTKISYKMSRRVSRRAAGPTEADYATYRRSRIDHRIPL